MPQIPQLGTQEPPQRLLNRRQRLPRHPIRPRTAPHRRRAPHRHTTHHGRRKHRLQPRPRQHPARIHHPLLRRRRIPNSVLLPRIRRVRPDHPRRGHALHRHHATALAEVGVHPLSWWWWGKAEGCVLRVMLRDAIDVLDLGHGAWVHRGHGHAGRREAGHGGRGGRDAHVLLWRSAEVFDDGAVGEGGCPHGVWREGGLDWGLGHSWWKAWGWHGEGLCGHHARHLGVWWDGAIGLLGLVGVDGIVGDVAGAVHGGVGRVVLADFRLWVVWCVSRIC